MLYLKNVSLNFAVIFICVCFLAGCSQKPEFTYEKTSFSNLKGWKNEDVSDLLDPFLSKCLNTNKHKQICKQAQNLKPSEFKLFVEKNFDPYLLKADKQMLYTGYYKPLIKASFTKTNTYKYPLYTKPNDIIEVDLTKFGIEDGEKIQGRIQNKKLIPYYTREDIDKGKMSSEVLLWTQSYLDNFFLQIQGSGTVQFMNGKESYIAYAGNNGHKYTSIGKVLIDNKLMKKEDVSLFSLKKWLKDNPKKATNILQKNERYIFFKLTDKPSEGSLKIPLISERSLAVDPKYIPLGSMVFINTEITAMPNTYLNTTLFAQDTGSAIKGPDRADIFFGDTKEAEYKAAYQNSRGKLYLLSLKK